MKLLRITSVLVILFPLILLISCSPVPEISRDSDDDPVYGETRTKQTQIEFRLQNIMKRDEFRHTLPSMIIMSADYGDTIFSYKSDLLVRPASNQKILTSAAALKLLGPSYNYRTVIYRTGPIQDGHLNGDLIIKGFGDPLLNLDDLDRFVETLQLFGISEITGNIIVDDSFFDEVHWPSGWMWDDEPHPYVPYISALSVNSNIVSISVNRSNQPDNAVTVQVTPNSSYIQYELHTEPSKNNRNQELRIIPDRMSGRNNYLIKGDPSQSRLPRTFNVTVREPAMFTGILLQEKLSGAGIITRGTVMRAVKDSTAIPMVQTNTPLDSVLHAMNKVSDNLAAESTWKTIAAEQYGIPGSGDGGRSAIEHALAKFEINTSPSQFVDGSGVSFYNLVTSRMLAELLFRISEDPVLFKPFYESLSILGVDGTLMRRGIHSKASGRVRAKTGTLTGVSSLTGYIDTLHGERLIVAMLFQNFTLPAGRYRQIQDEICEILIHFNREASVLTSPISSSAD